jgi:hypothetical protein
MTVEGLRLVEVRQSFEAPAVTDVSRYVREEVRKLLRQPPPRRPAAPSSRDALLPGTRSSYGRRPVSGRSKRTRCSVWVTSSSTSGGGGSPFTRCRRPAA